MREGERQTARQKKIDSWTIFKQNESLDVDKWGSCGSGVVEFRVHYTLLGSACGNDRKYLSRMSRSFLCVCGAVAPSILDRHWKKGLTLEQAKAIMALCIQELHQRFTINLPKFIVKVVDKDGIREVNM